MKKMIAIVLLSLTSTAAFSAPAAHFFECRGLDGVEEYRVGINLKTNVAAFFDNDSTSYMKLTQTKSLETVPAQTQMIFKGKDGSFSSTLKLYFNLTKKNVSLYSIDKKGKSTQVGTAECVTAEPWDGLN